MDLNLSNVILQMRYLITPCYFGNLIAVVKISTSRKKKQYNYFIRILLVSVTLSQYNFRHAAISI